MAKPKYELLRSDFISLQGGERIYRIRHLVTGKLGGYIESEWNLSHDGRSWAHVDTQIWGQARVSGDAQILDRARVSGSARVSGEARVFEEAFLFDRVRIEGAAQVSGQVRLGGDVHVLDDGKISGVGECIDKKTIRGSEHWILAPDQIEDRPFVLMGLTQVIALPQKARGSRSLGPTAQILGQ